MLLDNKLRDFSFHANLGNPVEQWTRSVHSGWNERKKDKF